MSISLPLHPSPSQRNRDSRNYFTNNQATSPEALNGPLREFAKEPPSINDRLIVGVDFGTTFSG
jgi:hypothetical protein